MSAKRVVLLYGGRSTEHEISCRSAAYVARHLPKDRYELAVIAIAKDGSWWPQDASAWVEDPPEVLPITQDPDLRHQPASQALLRSFNPTMGSQWGEEAPPIVFPMLHSSGGEDGTLQGLLELCQLPYVGPDCGGSALAMDKILTKEVAAAAGVPVVPYVWFRKGEWQKEPRAWLDRITGSLSFPVFVKPARLGSSVGVSKARDKDELAAALDLAFGFDDKVLVEVGLTVREIEFGVLGGYEDPEISVAGESVAKVGYYDYKSKYQDPDASEVLIPAPITAEQRDEAQIMVKKVFQGLHLYGMARVDLFLTPQGRLFLNEVNTIPGFTSISQYPSLWQHEGYTPADLLIRLLTLAEERHAERQSLATSYSGA